MRTHHQEAQTTQEAAGVALLAHCPAPIIIRRLCAPDASHHILSLCIDEKLPIQLVCAIGGVAREQDTGATGIVDVAIHLRGTESMRTQERGCSSSGSGGGSMAQVKCMPLFYSVPPGVRTTRYTGKWVGLDKGAGTHMACDGWQ